MIFLFCLTHFKYYTIEVVSKCSLKFIAVYVFVLWKDSARKDDNLQVFTDIMFHLFPFVSSHRRWKECDVCLIGHVCFFSAKDE